METAQEMRPVYQRGKDDCLPAALASILELPLEVFPVAADGLDLQGAVQELEEKLLHSMGLALALVPGPAIPAGWSVKLSFVELERGGKTERVFHAFVAENGRVVHDPSGRKGYEDAPPIGWVVVYLLDPRAWVHREVRAWRGVDTKAKEV